MPDPKPIDPIVESARLPAALAVAKAFGLLPEPEADDTDEGAADG